VVAAKFVVQQEGAKQFGTKLLEIVKPANHLKFLSNV
jgi:hypothetical protein